MKSIKKNALRSFLFIFLGLAITTIAFAGASETPGPPGIPYIIGTTNNACDLKYAAPLTDGGSSIVVYLIEYKTKYGWFWEDGGASKELTYRVHNLKEESEVAFRVKAVNAAGIGEPSRASQLVTITGAH